MTNEGHYTSPSALRRGLTDRLKAMARGAGDAGLGTPGDTPTAAIPMIQTPTMAAPRAALASAARAAVTSI
jgi:hypothetical protein